MEARAAGMRGAGLEDRAAQAAEPQDLQGVPSRLQLRTGLYLCERNYARRPGQESLGRSRQNNPQSSHRDGNILCSHKPHGKTSEFTGYWVESSQGHHSQ